MLDTPAKKHEAFGLRLKIAVLRKHRTAAPFIEILEKSGVVKGAAFYYHLSGDRKPDAKVLRRYEQLLGTPVRWIEDGNNETLDELREALEAVQERDHQHPALIKVLAGAGFSDAPVNQPENQNITYIGNFSKIRHIPILSSDEISVLISGEKVISAMMAQTWPLDADAQVGPRAFIFEVTANDLSMTGPGALSFPPGTRVIIDPDATANPGQYLLIRHRTKSAWMLRRYRAAAPFGEASEYALEAINPSYDPLRVDDSADGWIYGGRAVTVLLNLP